MDWCSANDEFHTSMLLLPFIILTESLDSPLLLLCFRYLYEIGMHGGKEGLV